MSDLWEPCQFNDESHVYCEPPSKLDAMYDDLLLKVTGNMLVEQKIEVAKMVCKQLNENAHQQQRIAELEAEVQKHVDTIEAFAEYFNISCWVLDNGKLDITFNDDEDVLEWYDRMRLITENARLRAVLETAIDTMETIGGSSLDFDNYKDLLLRRATKCTAALEGSSVGDSDETNFDAVDSQNRYYHHNIHLDAEEYECAMMVLDDMEIPRADKDDKVYSLVGRIRCLADEA